MFYPADRVVEDSAQLWQDSTFPVALTALAELDVLAALNVWRVGKDEGLGGPSKWKGGPKEKDDTQQQQHQQQQQEKEKGSEMKGVALHLSTTT